MRKLTAVAFIVLSIVFASTVFQGQLASAAAVLQVFVTNDTANPVPVVQQGTVNANVPGTVTTRLAIPANQFSLSVDISQSFVISGPDPAGTNYALSSVSLANAAGLPALVNLATYSGTTTDCHNFSGAFQIANGPVAWIPGGDTVEMVFPQAFVLGAKPGAQTCLIALTLASVSMTIVGYRF